MGSGGPCGDAIRECRELIGAARRWRSRGRLLFEGKHTSAYCNRCRASLRALGPFPGDLADAELAHLLETGCLGAMYAEGGAGGYWRARPAGT